MKSRRVVLTLIFVLALSCVILGFILRGFLREYGTLPESAVDDLLALLEESGISADRSLVSGERTTAPVYVLDPGDYEKTVASLLSGSVPEKTYAVPDGRIFLMENGARLDFGEDFSFRYSMDGHRVNAYRVFDPVPSETALSGERQAKVEAVVTEFLDSGSRSFESAGRRVDIRCATDAVWETDGVQYALCSRSIDGVRIAANRVICALDGDTVSEAWGTWYFLTPAESYPAQLCDTLNILFNMKKEIGSASSTVTVNSVSLCYSLWFRGDGGGFSLIPCWQVVTDTMGSFLFNALDGSFYTRN